MRRCVVTAIVVTVIVGLPDLARARDSAWSSIGFTELGVAACSTPLSAADGGYGRLACGDGAGSSYAQARIGLDYEPNLEWRAHLHGLLRVRDGSDVGRELGLVEAYVERNWHLEPGARLRLRLGQSFLGNSRENTGPLWTSPDTLTLSALNSWIAEELRPIGAELSWRREFSEDTSFEAGIGSIQGNDTSGALLAWRGFALHQRTAVLGENVSTAPLLSLDPASGDFSLQRLYRTQPFGRDLDGRLGYSARGRLQIGAWRALFTAADNRGDRRLYGDEYAWHTRFLIVGFEFADGGPLRVAGEWLQGHTQMGLSPLPFVDAKFESAYLLGAWQFDPLWQLTLRAERFEIVEQDFSSAERNDETGHAQTIALIYTPSAAWRFALEYLRLNGTRPGLADERGATTDIGGNTLRFEIRRSF